MSTIRAAGLGTLTASNTATIVDPQTPANGIARLSPLVSFAPVTASGTAVDFVGIPSWARRITVLFNGVSTNGSSLVEVRIGSGSISSSGYLGYASTNGANISTTSGFPTTYAMAASYTIIGKMEICLLSGTTYASSSVLTLTPLNTTMGACNITLSGIMDRLRVTTVNGTDTFDAGTINVMYE
jgi:hypothetical protein